MNTWNNFDIEWSQEDIQELVCRDCGCRFEADFLWSINTIDTLDEKLPMCPQCGVIG